MSYKCTSCGYETANQANFCPKCGAQMVPVEPTPVANDKDKTSAAILALTVGCIGLQYFYIGKSTAGIICILISLLTCGVGATVLQIICIVQGYKMLTMSEAEFQSKYVNSISTFPIL